MNWDQLRYFQAVARLQNVSRAAEQLRMTQPALSRAIARLEDDLGVSLFERSGRAIVLTRAGGAFLRHAERAIDTVEAGTREARELAADAAALVSLGFLRTLGAAVAPQLVRAFQAEHPHVRFGFTQSNGLALEAMLVGGELGLALMAQAPSSPRIVWERFATQRFVVIVPPGHRLAARRSVRVAALRGETFLTFKRGHALRAFTDALCARAGFEPTIAFEADESNSLRGFANAGFGIAIVPQCGSADDRPSVDLADRHARREIGVARAVDRTLSHAEEAFRLFLLRTAQ